MLTYIDQCFIENIVKREGKERAVELIAECIDNIKESGKK